MPSIINVSACTDAPTPLRLASTTRHFSSALDNANPGLTGAADYCSEYKMEKLKYAFAEFNPNYFFLIQHNTIVETTEENLSFPIFKRNNPQNVE